MSEVVELPTDSNYPAPDGSEVRLLPNVAGGGLTHFRLPAGRVSRAVKHATVEEIWFLLAGTGEIWLSDRSQPFPLMVGRAFTIPVGVSFQFRNGGKGPAGHRCGHDAAMAGAGRGDRRRRLWPTTTVGSDSDR